MPHCTYRDYLLDLCEEPGALSQPRQEELLGEFDRLVYSVWELDPFGYRRQPEFFRLRDCGIVLVLQKNQVVGFSIYQRLRTPAGKRVIYRYVTAIEQCHQGNQLYEPISRLILTAEAARGTAEPLFCAWRTRNPKVWATMARQCVRIQPPITGGSQHSDLIEIGAHVAAQLYPTLTIELPTMVMPDAYHYLKYRHAQRHHDTVLDEYFNGLPERAAVLSVGELTGAATPADEHGANRGYC